ncbi:hypothetical protein pb186bvf_008910 [Paramecium bursaria]
MHIIIIIFLYSYQFEILKTLTFFSIQINGLVIKMIIYLKIGLEQPTMTQTSSIIILSAYSFINIKSIKSVQNPLRIINNHLRIPLYPFISLQIPLNPFRIPQESLELVCLTIQIQLTLS